MPDTQFHDPLHSALFTDLYALTMCQSYHTERMNETATFELIFREMPAARNYFVAAGLESVLEYLENFCFTSEDLTFLHSAGQFSADFLDRLKNLRFTGDVYAIPEGTTVFPNEPIVQVVAPLIEAQLVETMLINQVHFQTVLATKASRILTAAAPRVVVDFGARRAHGTDAALKVARSSYLVGAAGTSLVLAGQLFDIPIFGTMAHSYIQAHDDEIAAFEAFMRQFPHSTLLVDTYDTLNGVRSVIELSRRLGDRFTLKAIRLDSGNIRDLSRQARELLDAAGLRQVQIFVSNELEEQKISELIAGGAPIDGFGVGTRMAVSDDVPTIDLAYKLVEYDGRPRTKLSSHKVIYPWRKQVFRQTQNGRMIRDVIGRHDELFPGEPLLQPVMSGGSRLASARSTLEDARRFALKQRQQMPDEILAFAPARTTYSVGVSDLLKKDLKKLQDQFSPTIRS